MKSNTFVAFFVESAGQDAIEYALLAGFICIVCAKTLANLWGDLGAVWTYFNGLLSNPG
jgi:Flp pilus assembly pilin Flp